MVNRVLCIDDDQVQLMLCQMILKREQFSVHCDSCLNGQIALDYLEERMSNPSELPNLILLDLNMPVMDGWEFLELYKGKMASRLTDVKVVILSSSIDPADVQRSKEFSDLILGFIPKPMNKKAIENMREMPFISQCFQVS
jgi:CheY-like chemotaxis protein